MQSTKQRPRIISLRSKLPQSYSTTHATTGEPVLVSKEQNPQPAIESPRCNKSDRISKARNSNSAKVHSPSSTLADNFTASLDQYRENILDQVTKDVDSIHTELASNLDVLLLDVNHHFNQLTAVKETLQRPFNAETLVIQARQNGDASEVREEVSLLARISAFGQMRQEEQKILTDLWDEWEAIQMDIITLTAEVCGSGTISLSQEQQGSLKEGQQAQFESALISGQKVHDRTTDELNGLYQDLQDVEESFSQVALKTKQAVVEMQQQYNVQRTKLFRGLHRHMELLASL